MDDDDVRRWFDEYQDAFAACGRGERDTASLLAYHGVPLLVTTNDGFFPSTAGDQVVARVQQQVDLLRAAGYARTETLATEVTVLNSTSALHGGTFAWRRRDGSEIGTVTITYLVTDGPDGRRISAIVVRGPEDAASSPGVQ